MRAEGPAYVCLIEAQLHISESQGLKSKRKVVRSLKDRIRVRYGAAVAEIAGQETWQSSTLLIALVGDATVGERAERIEGLIESHCTGGCTFERDLRTLEDLRG